MHAARLLIVTGRPASGKSELARQLARRNGWALLEKDVIKEALSDALGAPGGAESRRLSDASFAVLFAIARRLLEAPRVLLLEGNFRCGEHEPQLLALATPVPVMIQVLCRASEAVRRERLAARAADPARHPVHPDARGDAGAAGAARSRDAFLALPGLQLVYDSSAADHDSFLQLARELERALAAESAAR
jgi:predicted kinase